MVNENDSEYYQRHNDCNYSQIDSWELKKEPMSLTQDEIEMAYEVLESMGVDVEEKTLITFTATSDDMVNLLVNIGRKLRLSNKGM